MSTQSRGWHMSARSLSRVGGTALLTAMVAAGWAWRDCTLLATGAVLAHRLFLLRMDHGAPWRALTAAVDALTAGVMTCAAGVALMIGAAAAGLGWWHPAAQHPGLAMLLLTTAGAGCCFARGAGEGAGEELRLWLCMLVGLLLATQARRSAIPAAPCLFVSAVGLTLVWTGFRLTNGASSVLLRSGSEPH